MTREDYISRWEEIIPAVFKAEDKLRDKLKGILEAYKNDKPAAMRLYVRLIAEEIVGGTTDDELA